jgi:hypothetical protein
MAHGRSEATMRFNHFDSTNFGFHANGQGTVNAVEATDRITLRARITKLVRRLSLRASWLVIKRKPAGSLALGLMSLIEMTPVTAMCPAYTAATRQQRHQRWMSGVVVDPGTVGVS